MDQIIIKPNPGALVAAQRSHVERPFKCSECHQAFRRVEHRNRHERSHEMERHLKCGYCRKGFYRADALKRHEKIHTEPKRSLLKEGARACLACAASRRKCSGDTPCLACEQRSLKCEYPDTGKSRQRSLGATPKEASDSFDAEHVTAISRRSMISWSNAPRSPVAGGQSPDRTYHPVGSNQADEVKHALSHQNCAKNSYTSQTTQDDPVFHSPISPPQPQLHTSQFQSSNARNEYHEGPQATELRYHNAFASIIELPDTWAPEFPMEDRENGPESSNQHNSHFLDDAPDIREVSDEEQPHSSQHEERNLKREYGGAQLQRRRSRSPVPIYPTTSPYLLEFGVPAFIEFSEKRSRRALVDHFCNVFSHLVVFSEDPENPFQQLILPLARKGSPIMNAIYALSSAHLENRGVDTEEKSLYFHNEATRGLARLINHVEKSSEEDMLGAILLLVYYEALVQRDSSNIVISHLKGAITVINSYSQSSSPTSMFLQRAFRYYDVITALSFGTTPISTTSTPLLPLNMLSASCLSPLNNIDSLLGMSTNFWHIIHRLSLLSELKREMQKAEACNNTMKVIVLRTELECTSQAIEHALTRWSPSIQLPYEPSTTKSSNYLRPTTASSLQLFNSLPHGSTYWDHDLSFYNTTTTDGLTDSDASHIYSIANNAEAYRQAALVFLYRNIHMLERSHPKVQLHGHLTLAACVRVVGCAGPIPALLWPLFIGSVEAVSEEDRNIATMAFSGTERRQGMLNITRAWEVVQEVWRRGNEGEEVEWRSVCEEMRVNLVFG